MGEGKTKTMRGWNIVGELGAYYVSFCELRKEAISRHESDLGDTWANCRKRGDRCVRAELRYETHD